MLIELIGCLVCMGILLGGVMHISVNVMSIRDMSSAIFLQQLKYSAQYNKNRQVFEIKDHKINGEIDTTYGDCYLAWTLNGNTSKEGICRNERGRLTLRLTEGGIGYPL